VCEYDKIVLTFFLRYSVMEFSCWKFVERGSNVVQLWKGLSTQSYLKDLIFIKLTKLI